MKHKGKLRRVWSRLNDMRMERKLVLVFVLLISLPLTFISYVSYTNYSNSIEEKTIVYSSNLLSNMMDRTDDYVEDMVRISSIPAFQEDIRENLIRSNHYHENHAEASGESGTPVIPSEFDLLLSIQRGIESNISFINNIKRGANSVYIFDIYGSGYYSAVNGAVRLDLNGSYAEWKERLASSTGEAVLIGTQKYTSTLRSEKYAFTVVRKIMDKTTLQPIGLIAVDMDMSIFADQISQLDRITGGSTLIVDEDGNVIYDSDRRLLATNAGNNPVFTQASGSSGSFYAEDGGERKLFIYTRSSDTKWKAVTSIPLKELTKGSAVIRNVTIAASLVTVGLAMLVSVIFSFALTKPLRKMMRLMKNVQEGDFSVQFPVKHRDEIGLLGNQFNRMIVRIDELIQDIYLSETKRREAELHALQTQINPHFMYNTLETIRMAAELNDDTPVADMISLLGKQLRYSISSVNEEVTLEKELQHVRHYVELLNYRYPDRFRLAIDIPQQLAAYPMPKLVLQPIVENAIYHGLDQSKPLLSIRITGQFRDRHVLLTIQDNGTGMDEGTVRRLNDRFSGRHRREEPGGGGIGLSNVNERLMLHFGAACGLNVESGLGVFTSIHIRLPERSSGYEPAADEQGRRKEAL